MVQRTRRAVGITGALRGLVLVGLSALVVACGGGASGSSEEPVLEPEPSVARVEIASSGRFLAAQGGTSQLTATAYSAEGTVVPAATLNWESSDPSQVSVDGTGKLTAVVANGSADITVRAGTVASRPALVMVATPGAQTRMLAPDEVSGAPVPLVDSDGDPTGQFTVTLASGAKAAQAGDLLVAAEPTLVGRVIEVRANGALLMEMVDPMRAFPRLNVVATGNFSNDDFVASADAAQALSTPGRQRARAARQDVAGALASLKCEGASAASIKAEAQRISVDVSRAGYTRTGSWAEGYTLVVHGPVVVTMGLTVTANLAAGASVKCSLLLGHLPLPGGVPLWMLGAKVPVKVGFEATAEAKGLEAKYELTQTHTMDFRLGFSDAPEAAKRWVLEGSSQHEQRHDWTATNQTGRLGYKFAVFGSVAVDMAPDFLGNEIFKFTLAQAKLKREFAADTAPAATQVADSQWAAKYDWADTASLKTLLSLNEEGKPGNYLTRVLAAPELVPTAIDLKLNAWTSPKLKSLTAGTTPFSAGQTRTFDLQLDPASLTLPGAGYPLTSVHLALKRPDGSFFGLPVIQETATPGQSTFKLTTVITDDMLGGELYAFANVTPGWLNLNHEMELGKIGIDTADDNWEGTIERPIACTAPPAEAPYWQFNDPCNTPYPSSLYNAFDTRFLFDDVSDNVVFEGDMNARTKRVLPLGWRSTDSEWSMTVDTAIKMRLADSAGYRIHTFTGQNNYRFVVTHRTADRMEGTYTATVTSGYWPLASGCVAPTQDPVCASAWRLVATTASGRWSAQLQRSSGVPIDQWLKAPDMKGYDFCFLGNSAMYNATDASANLLSGYVVVLPGWDTNAGVPVPGGCKYDG